MRVRVIKSNSRDYLEKDVTELIGQEFDVVDTDEEGVYISARGMDEYFLYYDEVEVLRS
jgi:hypothetical protein